MEIEKKWCVYVGEQCIAIVYASIKWTIKQVKEWLATELGCDYMAMDMRLAN